MITEMDIFPVLAEHVLLWPTAQLGYVSALRTQDARETFSYYFRSTGAMIGYMWFRSSCDVNKLLIFLIAGQCGQPQGRTDSESATPLVEESDAN
jgi:hypothetical protein